MHEYVVMEVTEEVREEMKRYPDRALVMLPEDVEYWFDDRKATVVSRVNPTDVTAYDGMFFTFEEAMMGNLYDYILDKNDGDEEKAQRDYEHLQWAPCLLVRYCEKKD